tara:strand:- start:3224 stop:3952 length:729 start_codon:yes stop_codon:yes gene_type:complete
MLIETQAIVINTLKFGDADLIARCYCKEIGLKSFLLKGILNSKKGRLSKSLFQPLSLIRLITLIKNENSEGLLFIREAHLHYPLNEIPTDIKKNTVGQFLGEVLSRVISEEGAPNPQFYQFIEEKIIYLETQSFSPIFHLKFMTELSHHLGFYPNKSSINEDYFDMETGCFCSNTPSKFLVSGPVVVAFKELLGIKFDQLKQISVPNTIRTKLLVVLLDYYNLHLENFGKIKSIDILHEIFR